MKVIYSNKNISPYGGILPILKAINDCGIPNVIRRTLGVRAQQALYGYEDVFLAWVLTTLCGGMRLDHITNLKKKLRIIPGLKLPSHDTLGRVMKKLATEQRAKEIVSGSGKKQHMHTNLYNENDKMSEMLIKVTKRIGALEVGRKYTLHIDSTFIETNCATSHKDSKYKRYGYYPMVCLIDDMPVYISMRNGDVNAKFQLKECLERCLDLLAANNITISRVIIDNAGYIVEVMKMLTDRGIAFNIHMQYNSYYKRMVKELDKVMNWEKIELETAYFVRDCEVGDFHYTPNESEYAYRIVAAREYTRRTKINRENRAERVRRKNVEEHFSKLEKNKPGIVKRYSKPYALGEWSLHDKYKVKLIITNDIKTSPKDLLLEYNQRGATERQFDAMKNDFGWRLPPFMKMEQNTVFMIAAALANNIFRGILKRFKKVFKELRLETRLPEFQFVFIEVACQLVKKDFYRYFHPAFDYEKLM
jgi:hypothetical protein